MTLDSIATTQVRSEASESRKSVPACPDTDCYSCKVQETQPDGDGARTAKKQRFARGEQAAEAAAEKKTKRQKDQKKPAVKESSARVNNAGISKKGNQLLHPKKL